jgi:hypothetical protein
MYFGMRRRGERKKRVRGEVLTDEQRGGVSTTCNEAKGVSYFRNYKIEKLSYL